MILQLDQVCASYGQSQVLRGVSLYIDRGEIVCLLGRNGMGKTTLLRSVMGLMTITAGKIYLNGEDITSLPTHKISRLGVSFIPEDRGILHGLSILENLKLGMARRKGRQEGFMNEILQVFPVLGERLNQRAGSLSGGEQQMLAMARAWVGDPDLMLVDEFSEGLQPSVIGRIAEAIRGICGKGVAVLLVEQNTKLALSLADRGYIMGKGEIVHQGKREELVGNDQILKKYLVI